MTYIVVFAELASAAADSDTLAEFCDWCRQ